MPTLVTVTNPAVNEIVVSSSYLQSAGSVNRLGPSQIEHTSATNALVDDIFFKFYRCDDSSGSKVYTPLDVSFAISNVTIENQFLTMLFSQYYGDSIFVNDIGGSFIDIAERLNGVVTPSTPLQSTLTMPSASSNYVEFVGMGLSSWVGANYINGGSVGRPTALWGNRVGQVHLTSTDPTVTPVNALYDNADSGCWQFSDFGTDGIIVYTNLLSNGAFFAPGLSVWSQMLCVWPILADVLLADYACIFNNLDQSFLRSGLGYFDRSARRDTYYGWAGNYLQSIFNDWSIPVISPIWSMSDIAMCAYVTYGALAANPSNNYGSLADPSKSWRYVGPTASFNVDAVNEKSARSSLCALWANECRFGNSDPLSSAIPSFESDVAALGYVSVGDYISTSLGTSTEGYNAHVYKYILDEKCGMIPTSTRSYVTNGVSWSSKLASQPTLLRCFTDDANAYPKYFGEAHDNFYGTAVGTYGEALKNRIEDGSLIIVQPTNSGQSNHIRHWLYTP
jgi:hypothetical protein